VTAAAEHFLQPYLSSLLEASFFLVNASNMQRTIAFACLPVGQLAPLAVTMPLLALITKP